MHFPSLALASSLGLLALVAAVPRPQATTTPPSTVSPPSKYHLKTKVIDGGDETKDGFYVVSYHTGAGLDDAVLEATAEHAAVGFLNATYQQFDFNTSFPWSFALGGDTNYAAWDPVSINTGQQTLGFYFNETGLQWDYAQDGFAGWIACDWWHGLPQLFWKFNYYDVALPCSCAQVQLYPVPV